jgi:hypothetical protein
MSTFLILRPGVSLRRSADPDVASLSPAAFI